VLADLAVGWIGLGKMGRPMSQRLHRESARVYVNSRNRRAVDEMIALGLQGVASPREAAENANIIILTLFDSASIRAVFAGQDGIIAGIRSGSLVIDMGTTDVVATRDFAAMVAASGGRYLDAPVSGGTHGATEGTLTIMVGGNEADVQRAMPVFSVLGNRVTHVGPVGSGQVVKAANQVIVGLSIIAVAEAFALASRSGVDLLRTREALQGGFADSRILREHGLRMIHGNYVPGATIEVQRKDMNQALALAKSLGLELPMAALSAQCFDAAVNRGFGQLDQSAIFQLLQSTVS
jgi:3-hydroxyisobutyrate dehydrogenase-like beta-hydroxyacid dehydrogenase